MTFLSPVMEYNWTHGAIRGILHPSFGEGNIVMTWDAEDRAKYNKSSKDWTPEERERNRVWQKERRDAKAIAEGREPGRVGRSPTLTPEEKEASRIAQNRKRSLRANAKKKRVKAERAIAQGREPGKVGQPRVLTDEQRTENLKANQVRWRQGHLEEARANDARRAREKTAARALAEGRVPGVLGHLAVFTAEELAVYLERWPRDKDVYHARVKTQNSRAKRLGVVSALTAMDIREIYIEQAGYCAFCAQPFGDEIPEIDHWEAIALGGPNTKENVKLLHMRCNRTKGGKPLTELGLVADELTKKET